MLSEHAIVFDSNDVIGVIRVIFFQVEQDFEFYASLMLEFLLVPDDLQSYDFFCFVVNAFQSLTERSFT